MKQIEFSIELAQAFFSSEEAFPVDLDDAWKWLGYREKRNALRQLTNNFEEAVDYTFAFKGESDVPLTFSDFAGSSPDKYMLTVECFKLLAMLAETANGKQVRKYFLECETVAKSAASKLAIASAEIARLKSLMESPQGAPFSGTTAHRPDPAAYIKGVRCEANLVWADMGPFDPKTAQRIVDNLIGAADVYLRQYIETGKGNVVAASAQLTMTWISTTPKKMQVFVIPPLPEHEQIVAIPTGITPGRTPRFQTFDSVAIYAAAKLALERAGSPQAIDLHSLSLAVFAPAVLDWCRANKFKLGLSLTRALTTGGYPHSYAFRYNMTDATTKGVSHGVVWYKDGAVK